MLTQHEWEDNCDGLAAASNQPRNLRIVLASGLTIEGLIHPSEMKYIFRDQNGLAIKSADSSIMKDVAIVLPAGDLKAITYG